MVTSLLSADDAREVEAAITRVERATSAELVVAVVPRSSDHWQGRVVVAFAWGLSAAAASAYFRPEIALLSGLALELVVAVLSFGLLGIPALHRVLVPPARAERAAHARAFQLFAERGLYGTSRRTALLIFVTELERRVVLLGDATIHAELGQTGWQTEVDRLIARIRENRLKEGLLEVIAALEPKLHAAAPRRDTDTNELPDSVLRD